MQALHVTLSGTEQRGGCQHQEKVPQYKNKNDDEEENEIGQ